MNGLRRISSWPAAVWLWLAMASALMAHGDLHERILDLTAHIRQSPGKGELYFQRAELHRRHGSAAEALADYDQAARLAPELPDLDLGRGQTFLAAGKTAESLQALDRFLLSHPGHVPAHVARAAAHTQAGHHLAAAEDYNRAIQNARPPEPEYYLARAKALAAAGQGHIDIALTGLEEGLARVGKVLTLELLAVDLEISMKRYEAAIERIERLRKQAGRQEFWLERRGDILQQAGRPKEARLSYQAAFEAIQSRSGRLRATGAAKEIEERLREKLNRSLPHAKS